MSRTTALAVVPNRRPVELAEFRNAHGWSPSIWNRLVKANYGYDGYVLMGEGERHLDRLWQTIEELPEWQQAPLVLTFDTGVIPHQAFEWAAEQMDEFEARLPEKANYANHVPAMADLLRTKPEAPLFGVHGTSVSENPFDPMHYCDGFDPPREVDGGCDFIAEFGYCEGHGSGVSLLPGMYVLERHRHLLPREWLPDGYDDDMADMPEMDFA